MVSPFLDKQHGTERCVAEQVEGLASNYEVHVYSQRVENIDLGRVVWHKVPRLPGPHLLSYCWWFVANHVWRWWDRNVKGLKFDLTYTPGVNCLDADVIHVHILFSEFLRQVAGELRLRKNPVSAWPRLLHRKIYYRLIIGLEKIVYARRATCLAAISRKTRDDLKKRFPGRGEIPVIYNGIEISRFNTKNRLELRAKARAELGFSDSDFVLLLIGNDWKKKGLEYVLQAMGRLNGLADKQGTPPENPAAPQHEGSLSARPEVAQQEGSLSAKPAELDGGPNPAGKLEGRDKLDNLSDKTEAHGPQRGPTIKLIVAGRDSIAPFSTRTDRYPPSQTVQLLPIRPDVEFYYAASDAYVAPALEDAFGLPPLEAMGCGLPVVVSSTSGISEIVNAGVDAIVLKDPRNVGALIAAISELTENSIRRNEIGVQAAITAERYSWRQNVSQLEAIFENILLSRNAGASVATIAGSPQLPKHQHHPRIAVVSPFLDRHHGTERRASELVERFSRDYGFEVHIYSQSVSEIARVQPFKGFAESNGEFVDHESAAGKTAGDGIDEGRIFWHKLSRVPGPHLFNYIWWFASNHTLRWWDRHFRDGDYDLVYTPGINCLDADVASVHIIFSEFYRLVKSELKLSANPVRSWPRMIHRRLYYSLIIALENIIYAHRPPRLAAISRKTKDDVLGRWKRDDQIPIVYGGLDFRRFNPERRAGMRLHVRRQLDLGDDLFVLLMIGNDWKKKGLETLMRAMGHLPIPQLRLIVAGQDSLAPYTNLLITHDLADRLIFLPIRSDVEFYYAAADAYICPSLEDAFAYPPFEAMATGLPVVVSSQAGVSELVTDRVDGLVLPDPHDAETLQRLIHELYADPSLRARLGENAAHTASQYTWERNADQFRALFEEILHAKAAA